MKSMTAFTYSSIELDGCQIGCNLTSVNSKFLDVNLSLPEPFQPYQTLIYGKVRERIKRGRVEMTIYFENDNYFNSPLYLKNIELYIERLLTLKKKFNLKGDIDIALLSSVPDVFKNRKIIEIHLKKLESFIEGLLDDLIKTKEREGEFIKNDLTEKVNCLKEALEFIQGRARESSKEQKEKILGDIKRLKDLDIEISRDDINLFAFKGDVDEELVRLRSHISYFGELLGMDGAVGRRLRFLLQEMVREINTVGAKAFSSEVVHRVIDLKELLDEMREQVENIE